MSQFDIFGGVRMDDLRVMDLTRKIMKEKPVTYKSHRLLMREVAKEIGCTFIGNLSSDDQTRFDTLVDLSPDFERSARKVRQEEEAKAKAGMGGVVGPEAKLPDIVIEQNHADEEDPFDALAREQKKKKRW